MVLCAGGKKLGGIPVCLNRHPDGLLLAEKSIQGIFSENYDKILYVFTKDDDEDFGLSDIILSELGKKYPVEALVLPKKTDGPASTVYQTIKQSGLEGCFAVRDCLNGIKLKEDGDGNYVAGLDLSKYDGEVLFPRSKSFIIINEQYQVLDIIEKKFRSDVISVGLYGFGDVKDYCMAYEHLSDGTYPVEKLYVSHVISYLIGYDRAIFHCLDVLEHDDWGSEDTWNILKKKYGD